MAPKVQRSLGAFYDTSLNGQFLAPLSKNTTIVATHMFPTDYRVTKKFYRLLKVELKRKFITVQYPDENILVHYF